MSRAKTVYMLAPVAPPCFSARDQWIEYLTHAAEYQRPNHAGPLLRDGDETVFNFNFGFCHDCTATHRRAMVAQEKCRPSHLVKLQAALQQSPADAEASV